MIDRRMSRPPQRVEDLLLQRILVLDGATATMLQDRAGGGGIDALCLSAPDAVRDLHRTYLAAGADIIKTNSFNATRLVQADYGLADRVSALNEAAAALARSAADEAERADPARPRFVAGVLGPARRSAALRRTSFEILVETYAEAARGLIAGGADLLLIETVCDSRDAAAAVHAVHELEQTSGRRVPLMISATVDRGGRTLMGQSIEAFWNAISHASPLAVGLNCAFGAAALRPPLRALAHAAACPISIHPNAGLPDALGTNPDGPQAMAATLRAFAEEGLVNIVGGCCGTTPEHIATLAAAVRGVAPRRVERSRPISPSGRVR